MKRGNSLIGLLAAIVIVAVLAVVFMRGSHWLSAPGTGSTRQDGLGKTIPGAVKARAMDDVCIAHLHDLRMALTLAHDSDPDDKWPATLEETRQGPEFYKCPIGGERYRYNPETGEVKCVHPGHEKY